jgi:hypothetical protein
MEVQIITAVDGLPVKSAAQLATQSVWLPLGREVGLSY